MSNTAPTYPHGPPETQQERNDLLNRLVTERYPRGPHQAPRATKTTPRPYETGPIPPGGGYTRPTEPPKRGAGTPDTPHRPITQTGGTP